MIKKNTLTKATTRATFLVILSVLICASALSSLAFTISSAGSTLIAFSYLFNRSICMVMARCHGALVSLARFQERQNLVKYKFRNIHQRLVNALICI